MAKKSGSKGVASAGYISIQADGEKPTPSQEPSGKKMKQKGQKQANKRGVILLSHIPNGFYETQMFSFFSQFGRVTRLKLIRSKKTGRSRQFAFIEFQFEEVAKVAAETMNNYLMFQKILKCKLIPLEDLKASTFRNWQYKYHVPKTRKKAIAEHNTPLVDPEKIAKKKRKTLVKRQALQKKLDDLGIDYDVLNIKVNKSFIPPLRTRASSKDMEQLRAKEQLMDDECFPDFDDEVEDVVRQTESAGASDGGVGQEKPRSPAKNVEILDSSETAIPKAETHTQEEDESEFGVMVVDLDDSEVTFKTPPAEAKIRRKSLRMYKVKKSVNDNADSEPSDKSMTPKGRSKKASSKRKKIQSDLDSPVECTEKSSSLGSTPVMTEAKRRKKSPNTERKPSRKKSKLNRTM